MSQLSDDCMIEPLPIEEQKITPVKCVVNHTHFAQCGVLTKVAGREKRGVSFGFILNFKTGKTTTFPQVRSGEFQKTGIVFNFCPFCGVSLKRLYRK